MLAEPAPSASVVIPVKDGARWLGEVLAAVSRRNLGLEVLVIDSGSRDHSVDIARAAGVSVLEIEPASFGHGRTRNMGAPRTSGELVGFLTQDATPVPECLPRIASPTRSPIAYARSSGRTCRRPRPRR